MIRQLSDPPHETPSGIIENSAHLYLNIAPPLQGSLQQPHNILPLHTGTVEPLGPFNQGGLVEPLLLQWEGEGEAQGQDLILDISVYDKISQTPETVD